MAVTQQPAAPHKATIAPIEYLQARKRKRSVEYDNTYYQSPLDQPDTKAKENYVEKCQAFGSIHKANALESGNELEYSEDAGADEEDLAVLEPEVRVQDTK
ncbi:hypothetical protein N7463_001528 [Penicillium fimorum]|uniref:Uncharacterized protein n=1 Tax=Penicillium fimorum TaxID=1882269 RepID=A0A9W9Y6B1_9EURO|nr:hypothetical protein N7463_001528 [Penicillium fimorum]